VLIAAFVLFNVFRNIRQTLRIILQGTPAEIEQEHIVEHIKQMPHVNTIHDLHIWSLSEEYNVLTIHITLKEPLPMDALAELKKQIRGMLKEEDIHHATIEFEMPDEPCDFVNCV
jgi:cobalt-zinc-cadmium efflux system protein